MCCCPGGTAGPWSGCCAGSSAGFWAGFWAVGVLWAGFWAGDRGGALAPGVGCRVSRGPCGSSPCDRPRAGPPGRANGPGGGACHGVFCDGVPLTPGRVRDSRRGLAGQTIWSVRASASWSPAEAAGASSAADPVEDRCSSRSAGPAGELGSSRSRRHPAGLDAGGSCVVGPRPPGLACLPPGTNRMTGAVGVSSSGCSVSDDCSVSDCSVSADRPVPSSGSSEARSLSGSEPVEELVGAAWRPAPEAESPGADEDVRAGSSGSSDRAAGMSERSSDAGELSSADAAGASTSPDTAGASTSPDIAGASTSPGAAGPPVSAGAAGTSGPSAATDPAGSPDAADSPGLPGTSECPGADGSSDGRGDEDSSG